MIASKADVFSSREVPADAVEALGQLMAKTWAAALADQVGDRSFTVEYANDPDDYGPTVSIIGSASD